MSEPVAPLLVSSEAVASDDPYDVILSNIEVVNALAELLAPDELRPEALMSYYTDFYHAQMSSGGFSQFVLNSGWSPLVLDAVEAGLEAMEAPRHGAVFAAARAVVDGLSEDELEDFFGSDQTGVNELRDRIDEAAAGFAEAEDDLVLRNCAFLRSRPGLTVVPEEELGDAVDDVLDALPDIEEREALREAEVGDLLTESLVLLALGLCASIGANVHNVTDGPPADEGSAGMHLETDRGPLTFRVIGDDAVLFDGETSEELARVNIAEVLGDDED